MSSVNSNSQTVILCAGGINHTNLPIHTNQTNAMVPVNGKPVIAWVLDDLAEKGFDRNLHIVVRSNYDRLIRFLNKYYFNKVELDIIKIENSSSIIESLKYGLKNCQESAATQVVLGDTLIKDPFNGDLDCIYIAETVESEKWCVVQFDEQDIARQYINKESNNGELSYAVSGYYSFSNTKLLKQAVNSVLSNHGKELSDVLQEYGKTCPIKVKKALEWYDFGHIDEFINSKKQLLRSRAFNSIEIDPVLNTLTKRSDNKEKLRDELNWYKTIPENLKIFTPRLLNPGNGDDEVKIVQEYYGYPTLSELFVYGELSFSVWKHVLDYLLVIHGEFKKESVVLAPEVLELIYGVKTWERVDHAMQQPEIDEMFHIKHIKLNNRELLNISELKDFLDTSIHKLSQSTAGCVIHGDFHFGNILYDLINQIVRLIDPRGSFGNPGIYGDPRYDIAKLMHSISGKFDLITSDLFTIKENGNCFETELFTNEVHPQIERYFNKRIIELGYNLDEIKLIEALLFISMVPLHSDYPLRQKMMYLTGIEKLNDLYENSN